MRTVRGDTLPYDALLVAVGASPDVAIPGALTFCGPRDVAAFSALLDDLDAGRVQRVAFAVPTSVSWALPLYELALMTGEHVRAKRLQDVGLVIVTPEHAPLEAFGPRVASHIWGLLAERGIAMRAHTVSLRAGPGGLVVAHGEPVQVERIVSLPRLGGPWIGGLPHDEQGFLATDAHGAVLGVEAVWAAGDGTAFPLKQGGLAAQQADAAAAAIAASLGADVTPDPFRPVLRGMLIDPTGAALPRFHARRSALGASVVAADEGRRRPPRTLSGSRRTRRAGRARGDRRRRAAARPRRAPREPRRARAGAALPGRRGPGPRQPAARRGGAPRAAGERARRDLIGRLDGPAGRLRGSSARCAGFYGWVRWPGRSSLT